MKSIWNGGLSFGLVNIPIRMYSAVEQKRIKFKLLKKENLSPIKYLRTCALCDGEEVPWGDVVKGIKMPSGKYLVLDIEKIRSLRPKRTQSIEIVEFTDLGQVDHIFFDRHYFLGPERSGQKTFQLFKEVLQRSAKVAIGIFVMRDKEHLCMIQSYKKGMMLTTLSFSDEVKDIDDIEELGPDMDLKKDELEIAQQLIDKMTIDRFNMGRFKNSFEEEILKLMEKQANGEEIPIGIIGAEQKSDDELLDALISSLKEKT